VPVFRFDKTLGITRNLKVFLKLRGGVTRGAVPDVDWYKKQAQNLRIARRKDRQLIKEQRKKIKEQTKALRYARRRTNENKTKSAQRKQEISRPKDGLRVAEERVKDATKGRTAPPTEGGEPKTGTLPDLVNIGARKRGAMITTTGRSNPNGPSVDTPRLIVRPIGGLANRMRVITSFRMLARYSGRDFELCWAPSDGWSEEDLGDLFENDFPRVPLDEFERYSQDGLDLHNAVQIQGYSNERTWEWREGSGMHQVFDLEAFPVVTYLGPHKSDRLLDPATRARLFPNLKSDYQASVKEWSPVPSIRAEVEGLTASFGPHTIGVHIRRGDAWNQPKASLASEYRRSTDAAFIVRMDAEMEAEPRTNFFLATDCAATEERFRERYGEAVMVNRDKRFVPSVSRRPKDNQRDAMIDMFALARTQKILGNNHSSFSVMAADIGGIRLERALEN
jgi:hypothetical protein